MKPEVILVLRLKVFSLGSRQISHDKPEPAMVYYKIKLDYLLEVIRPERKDTKLKGNICRRTRRKILLYRG